VTHQRLLEKLHKHGIAGKVLGVIDKNSSGDEIANVNFFTTSHM